MAEPRGLVIGAPASGSGKTLITLGLLRALARKGHAVSSAKAGPDYIDPCFHAAASGKSCVNLDGWAMRGKLVSSLAAKRASDADLFLVEGVMGLFDGATGGGGSTADLAVALGLPVILVVDAPRQGQSVSALVKGFADFRDDCHVASVIFNRVASETHASLLRDSVKSLGIGVLGAIPETEGLTVPSRHLGLVQAGEHKGLDDFLDRAADLMDREIDMNALTANAMPMQSSQADARHLAPLGQRIAVAQDDAFRFSYPHLLENWRNDGAEIMTFSPLSNDAPAGIADAIYLPGGYPELHAGRLSANTVFMEGLRQAAQRDALVYGECGGYMVLGEYLIDGDKNRHEMAGLLPVGTSFAKRGLKLGYRRLEHSGMLPWPKHLRGHEFHYSTLDWEGDGQHLFDAEDSRGARLGAMGLRRGNVMGSYVHIIDQEDAS